MEEMELTLDDILEQVEASQANLRKLELHCKNLLLWIRENITASSGFIQMIKSELKRQNDLWKNH